MERSVKPSAANVTRPVRYYSSNAANGYGLKIWPMMAREIVDSRELIWSLARRNIAVKYRQSLLSYLWIIIPPVFAVAVFSYLATHRIINIGATPMPYLSYALFNISIWLLFSNAMTSSTRSLADAGSLVTRVNFPKITVVIASLGDALLEFFIRMTIVIGIFYLQGVHPGWAALMAPVLLVPLLLLAIGLGLFLSILNLVIRDTSSLLGIILNIGMFVTPVLYAPPRIEPFATLNLFNPVGHVLENMGSLLLYGELANTNMLAVTTLFSLVVFLSGWRIFNLTMPRVNERA